jgi:hypothetical protein
VHTACGGVLPQYYGANTLSKKRAPTRGRRLRTSRGKTPFALEPRTRGAERPSSLALEPVASHSSQHSCLSSSAPGRGKPPWRLAGRPWPPMDPMARWRCAPPASVAHLLAWHTPPAPSSNKKSPPSGGVALLCAPPRRFAATHRAFCLAFRPSPSFTGRHDNLVAPISHGRCAGVAELLSSQCSHYCWSSRAIRRSAFFVRKRSGLHQGPSKIGHPVARRTSRRAGTHTAGCSALPAWVRPAARARRRAAAASTLSAATKRRAEDRPAGIARRRHAQLRATSFVFV